MPTLVFENKCALTAEQVSSRLFTPEFDKLYMEKRKLGTVEYIEDKDSSRVTPGLDSISSALEYLHGWGVTDLERVAYVTSVSKKIEAGVYIADFSNSFSETLPQNWAQCISKCEGIVRVVDAALGKGSVITTTLIIEYDFGWFLNMWSRLFETTVQNCVEQVFACMFEEMEILQRA